MLHLGYLDEFGRKRKLEKGFKKHVYNLITDPTRSVVHYVGDEELSKQEFRSNPSRKKKIKDRVVVKYVGSEELPEEQTYNSSTWKKTKSAEPTQVVYYYDAGDNELEESEQQLEGNSSNEKKIRIQTEVLVNPEISVEPQVGVESEAVTPPSILVIQMGGKFC